MAITAFNAHQDAQMFKSEKLPAVANPNKAPSPKRTINAILPPLPPFLVTIDTIPPASIRIAKRIPPLPPISPVSPSVFAMPAAHDWNATITNNTIDKIPETSFQFFITLPPSILLNLTLYYFVVYVNDSCLYYSKSIKQSEVIFMKPLKNKVSITLDSDIIDAIKILAEQDDRSFSQYINMVLKEHLDHSSFCESHNK